MFDIEGLKQFIEKQVRKEVKRQRDAETVETVSWRRVGDHKLPTPEYKTNKAAGMDVHAYVEGMGHGGGDVIILEPGEWKLIRTGFKAIIPAGHEIQVRSRSGLALNSGVFVLNSPGTVDEDYPGEIGVIVANFNKMPFRVTHGDRIAQLVVSKVVRCATQETQEDPKEGDRSALGFGSTGVALDPKP